MSRAAKPQINVTLLKFMIWTAHNPSQRIADHLPFQVSSQSTCGSLVDLLRTVDDIVAFHDDDLFSQFNE